MFLYYLRHGQTEANKQHILCGSEIDVPLNATGMMQAEQLAASPAFLPLKGTIATICCSPLLRARQTAEILNHVLGVPLVINEKLREWQIGQWAGQDDTDLWPKLHGWLEDPPGGETRKQFMRRVAVGIAESLKHPQPVLIVAHGMVWDAMDIVYGLGEIDLPHCDVQKIPSSALTNPYFPEF